MARRDSSIRGSVGTVPQALAAVPQRSFHLQSDAGTAEDEAAGGALVPPPRLREPSQKAEGAVGRRSSGRRRAAEARRSLAGATDPISPPISSRLVVDASSSFEPFAISRRATPFASRTARVGTATSRSVTDSPSPRISNRTVRTTTSSRSNTGLEVRRTSRDAARSTRTKRRDGALAGSYDACDFADALDAGAGRDSRYGPGCESRAALCARDGARGLGENGPRLPGLQLQVGVRPYSEDDGGP